MIAYLDTSVVLRIVLNQAAQLAEWDELTVGVSSELFRVESHCTLWRMQLHRRISETEYATMRETIDAIIVRVDLIALTPETLKLAALPRSKPVNTLDALHLATAILYRDGQPGHEPPILFATHDLELATAARAMHFRVIGA